MLRSCCVIVKAMLKLVETAEDYASIQPMVRRARADTIAAQEAKRLFETSTWDRTNVIIAPPHLEVHNLKAQWLIIALHSMNIIRPPPPVRAEQLV